MRRSIVLLCVCCLLTASLSGCATKAQQSAKETASPEAEAAEVDHNEDETSNLGLWTRAMGSVLIYLNDGNPYYFGGYAATDANREASISILSSSWGIESRTDLIKQVKKLLKTGDRAEYLKEAKEMKAMSKADLKTAFKQLSGDLLNHYKMVRYNWKTWKKKGLIAWDMCRISHLVQWGYVAGYLELDEAQALMEPAAQMLKDNFDNWDDVQNNWLDGYCLYACINRKQSDTDYTNRLALYETLKEEQTEDDLLYDDSLFTAEIVPISGLSYETLVEEVKAQKDSEDSVAENEEETDAAEEDTEANQTEQESEENGE